MKTLFFCNLIPRKTGAFEALLAAIGAEFAKAADEFVVVFAGEPIAPVAESLRSAGARWHVLQGWVEGGAERSVVSKRWSGEGEETRSAPASTEEASDRAVAADVDRGEGGTAERVHPWRFVIPALRLIRKERPDVAVVHFGNEMPTLVASLLTRLRGRRPRWVWQQDQQIQDPGRLGRHVSRIRLLAAGVERFVAVYEGGRQSLIKRGIPESRIRVIPNSIAPFQTQRAAGWLRRELDVSENAVLLLTTGSLIARKRIGFILQACAGLRVGASTDWRLLVIGEGPDRATLAAAARDLGIEQRVHFLGLRNDVRDLLAEADVLAHASLAETCTYAITESMAAGIPSVVTEAGAAREQITDGRSGFVVQRDDLKLFVSRLERLLSDPALRRAMGAAAREHWAAKFQLEGAAERYHRLYRDLSLGRSGMNPENMGDSDPSPDSS